MLVATARTCVWVPPASIAIATPAIAATGLSLPAGRLDQSVAAIGRHFHVTIGLVGVNPALHVGAVGDARSADDALGRLARGGAFRVVAVAPNLYRIVASAPTRAVPPPIGQIDMTPVIVTGRKRRELAAEVPATIAVIRPLTSMEPAPGSESLVRSLPSLSTSAAGGGANRLFIRGIGDAPLGGFGQQSVAFLLDDARLTYDGPDPDLALVDIDRVEVLEGPQGPLYGTGALGGIVRILPNGPDPSTSVVTATAGTGFLWHGGSSVSGNVIANLPLGSASAVRLVAYGARRPGWIDDRGGPHGVNNELLAGGRLAWRWRTASDWTVDVGLIGQWRRIADSRYVDGLLGDFTRPARRREPIESDFQGATFAIHGQVGAVEVHATSSLSSNEVDRRFATAIDDLSAPLILDSRSYRTIDQEIRISGSGRIDWLAGASFLSARTRATIGGPASAPLLQLDRSVSELAAYGEVGIALGRTIDAALGARAFMSRVHDEALEGGVGASLTPSTVRLTPSATLRWRPMEGLTAYVRYATAYRPGGIGIGQMIIGSDDEYRGDKLGGIETGIHWRRGALSFDGTLFSARWRAVQADFLLPSGLIATRNVGNGDNSGVEAALGLSLAGFDLTGRAIFQRARLEGTRITPIEFDDRRLPIVPDAAARIEIARPIHGPGWKGSVRVAVNAQGATRISFDRALDRRMPARVTADAELDFSRGPWSAALSGTNLTGSRVDAYAFGNPFLVGMSRERTPLQPRSLTITISRRF